MINPYVEIELEGKNITKLDAIKTSTEGFVIGSKTVTDTAFGSLGEQVTTVPTVVTVSQSLSFIKSDIEDAKANNTILDFRGRLTSLSTSRVKLVNNI